MKAVHDLACSNDTPPTDPRPALRQHLLRTAVIVAALGVLPFAWGAAPAWQVLGALVSVAMVIRSLQLVWRAAFSTDPRHLTWD
jgi:uncharacterized membrane protein YdbT with pleckstrin-like domain